MKAKRVMAALLSGLMVLSLAACGGSSSGDSSDGSTSGGEAAAELSGDLVVYSSAPEADNESLIEGFNEIYPDVNIEIVQGNQGEGIARVQAEADNPTIDVFYTVSMILTEMHTKIYSSSMYRLTTQTIRKLIVQTDTTTTAWFQQFVSVLTQSSLMNSALRSRDTTT